MPDNTPNKLFYMNCCPCYLVAHDSTICSTCARNIEHQLLKLDKVQGAVTLATRCRDGKVIETTALITGIKPGKLTTYATFLTTGEQKAIAFPTDFIISVDIKARRINCRTQVWRQVEKS